MVVATNITSLKSETGLFALAEEVYAQYGAGKGER